MLSIYTSYHIRHDIDDFTYALDSDQVYSLYLITLKFTASLHCCILSLLKPLDSPLRHCLVDHCMHYSEGWDSLSGC